MFAGGSIRRLPGPTPPPGWDASTWMASSCVVAPGASGWPLWAELADLAALTAQVRQELAVLRNEQTVKRNRPALVALGCVHDELACQVSVGERHVKPATVEIDVAGAKRDGLIPTRTGVSQETYEGPVASSLDGELGDLRGCPNSATP